MKLFVAYNTDLFFVVYDPFAGFVKHGIFNDLVFTVDIDDVEKGFNAAFDCICDVCERKGFIAFDNSSF